MTERADQITQLRTIVETRQLTPTALGQHVLALMRLSEAVFIVHDTNGGKSLAYARALSADATSYTLEFTRVRTLSALEVSELEAVGVGVFRSPRPLPQLEAHNVQG